MDLPKVTDEQMDAVKRVLERPSPILEAVKVAIASNPRRPTRRAILDLDLGDDGIMIHEHADGQFTIDVGSERCVLDAGQFRVFVERVTQIGRQKEWTPDEPITGNPDTPTA